MSKNSVNNLVRSSRAGDEFHYVWAARQCLRLLDFNTTLTELSIEGASNSADDASIQAGEYVIDVGEYHHDKNTDKLNYVIYHQLKHSTERLNEHFVPSELKNTIVGFSKRFREFKEKYGEKFTQNKLKFSFISNRLVDPKVKDTFSALKQKKATQTGNIEKKLLSYTELSFGELEVFAHCLHFNDSEGDYLVQREQLRLEISPLLVGNITRELLDSLVAMVKDKALPHTSHQPTIKKEDVLLRLGITSLDELFPAQPKFDKLVSPIPRQQQAEFLKTILASKLPVVIHASGGVGKSVLAQSLCENLPESSIGIVFDCFAAGTYRNASSPRHEHKQALVQIINELAIKGLCLPLLPSISATRDQYLRWFRQRIKQAATKLKEIDKTACVVIFIDAADNAEIAAEEMGEHCFAHQIMQERPPQGTRIVSLCRTERKHLLQLQNIDYTDLALEAFSMTETKQVLVARYDGILNEVELKEFQRLSGGNPRVQANALDQAESLQQALEYLGPNRTTVNEQIAYQLESIIKKIRRNHPDINVELLCSGLASLPPFIPIQILATIAGIQIETIKSFAADMGRPLWLIEDSLQFRDEPTETWFKETFEATPDQLDIFISHLKPLAYQYVYVAESLPSLLLKAQRYDELIELALSDTLLPDDDNPVNQRNVRLKRLQFSLKAALKKNDLLSVAKLALRTGEETAGNQRQLDLFTKNIDLLSQLQPSQKVQEIAFQRQLSGDWYGSENVYSASLLSHIESFQGEAKSYLRSSRSWLNIYFAERDKKKAKDPNEREALSDNDIVELATAHMNIHGEQSLIDFFSHWRPHELGFRVGGPIIRRLIDQEKFKAINELAIVGKDNTYFILAVANELAKLCKFLPKECVKHALILLTHKRTRIPKTENGLHREKGYLSAYIAVAEAALFYRLDCSKAKRLLRLYTLKRTDHSFISNHGLDDRISFLKAHVFIHCLNQQVSEQTLDMDSLMPKEWLSEKSSNKDEFEQIINALLPWLLLRLNLIQDNIQVTEFDLCIKHADEQSNRVTKSRYQQYDPLPHEIKLIRFEILVLSNGISMIEMKRFLSWLKPNSNTIRFLERMCFLHIAFRDDNVEKLRVPLEQSCYEFIQSIDEEPPESIAEYYVDLARAVLPLQKEEAKAYFDSAIEVVSKFGDEGLDRWQAINALAQRASYNDELSPSLAYRFVRCSEVISANDHNGLNWDEVIQTTAQLSSCSAFSILSRLRDRKVVSFEENLAILTEFLLSKKKLPPKTAWALTRFFGITGSEKILNHCLNQLPDQQIIFDSFIQKIRLKTTGISIWKRMKVIAERYHLRLENYDQVISFCEQKKEAEAAHQTHSSYASKEEKYNYNKLVADIDCSREDAVDIAYKRFHDINSTRSPEIFWRTIVNNVPIGSEFSFVKAVANSQYIDLYDARNIFQSIPDAWWKKISFKRNKNKIFEALCKQQSRALLSNSYTYKYHIENFFKQYDISEQLIAKAIVQGLVDGQNILEPRLLFALVKLLARMLSVDEAKQAFEYSLERLECFIDNEQAGGEWYDDLSPPVDLTESLTGMLWAALASPHSKMRWQAAHAIRQLGELGCDNEISALIAWVDKGSPNAFIDIKLPFYELHARLYLLIALARIAHDYPSILLPHAAFFKHIALESIPHVLIQYFSAQTALLLEEKQDDTFGKNTIQQLQSVNKSPFPMLKMEKHTKNVRQTPWHIEGTAGNRENIHFGWDFEHYWYKPLANKFGISSYQVEDIAEKIIREEWQLNTSGKYVNDPRSKQWEYGRHERLTEHRHGSYPRSDTLSFYFSYHAMFWSAGKLLATMPLIEDRSSWEENEWEYWFNRHTLTLNDGRWLADVCDPEPLEYRPWFNELERNKDWRWQVMPKDFLAVLIPPHKNNVWLNVGGWWSYVKEDRKEVVSLSTALVIPETSMALLRALQSCLDSNDYKIPDADDYLEISHNIFDMQGWLSDYDADKHFDEFDPYAEAVTHPALSPATFIQEQFVLHNDETKRQWLNSNNNVCLISEIWSHGEEKDHGGCKANGERIKASISFLIEMLKKLNKNLIIEIQIKRQYCNNYHYRKEDNEIRYHKPYCQLFILEQSGTLRTLHTCYELRKASC